MSKIPCPIIRIALKFSALTTLLLAPALAQAIDIYTEGFVPESVTGSEVQGARFGLSAAGWQVYAAAGSDLSDSSSDPSYIVYDVNNGTPDGDNFRTFLGGSSSVNLALISDAPVFSGTGLTFGFDHNDNTNGATNARFMVLIDSQWYVSESIDALSGYVTSTVTDASDWFLWTSETSVASVGGGFDIGTISGAAEGNFPGGSIDSFGLLIEDGNNFGSLRLDNVTITANSIPEPAATGAACGLLALLGCCCRRFRRS